MARKNPHEYGGGSFREQPETQHIKPDTTSVQYSHVLEDDTDFVNSACVRMYTTIRKYSYQLVKYINPYNYIEEDNPPVSGQTKQYAPIVYKPTSTEGCVNEGKDIFDILQNYYTVSNNELGFIAVTYNWKERHLKLEQGLNLLANCKNCDCENFIQGVVCPRGMFRDRNGYCPLDMELYKVKCPTCKQRITPDGSFGFGFYNCDFQITYKLVGQKEHKMRQEGRYKVFYFRKLSVSWNLFENLEAQISICTFV